MTPRRAFPATGHRLTDLDAALVPYGLTTLGEAPHDGGTLVLIGPSEPAFWPIFSRSPEFADGMTDPLDRYSRRILTMIASEQQARPLFPFGGPPYQPFFSWATASGRAWPSPIGFLVHDTAGLFVSFRGALFFADRAPAPATQAKPCDTCDAPCAVACPVGAFNDGYDVAACKSHISSPAGADCRTNGCLARRACPVGAGLRLPAQSAFHMEAFL